MGVRFRRDASVFDEEALKRLANLAYRGRSFAVGSSRVRRLLETGSRLGLTTSDTVVLATETLREIDDRSDFGEAMAAVLESFDAGRLLTGIREPLNRYVERTAVAALAVATCEQCRPSIPVRIDLGGTDIEATGPPPPAPPSPTAPQKRESVQLDRAAHWPGRTRDGFPEMTLEVQAWWPGLDSWEPLQLTVSVTQSLAHTGDTTVVLIQQPGDQRPARVEAVWLVRRPELSGLTPVFELRASMWQGDVEDAHHFRFLIASASPWCDELHEFLATRWISRGQSPSGPPEFDEPFGANPPGLPGVSKARAGKEPIP